MSCRISMFLQLITYSTLIGLPCAAAIFGNVRRANLGEFPFIVSIARIPTTDVDADNLHFCAGTLISKKSVVTASHCLIKKKAMHFEIIAGSERVGYGERYKPELWITFYEWKHRHRESRLTIDDIAIIILEGEGVKGQTGTPAKLVPIGFEHLDNTTVQIAGWGRTGNGSKPEYLRTAVLIVISNEQCSAKGTALKGKTFTVPPNFFCSVGDPWVVSSGGDSGNPILDTHHHLVGINIGVCPALNGHFPFECQLNSHLRLHHYRDFINHIVK